MDVSLAPDERVQVDLVLVDQALLGEGVGELAAPVHEQGTVDLVLQLRERVLEVPLEQGRVPLKIAGQGVGPDVLRHRVDHVTPSTPRDCCGLARGGVARATPEEVPEAASATFFDRIARFGLAGNAYLYRDESEVPEAIARRADLLLNFDQRIDPAVLARSRRTAFVDVDPGLLQFWMATGQLKIAPHDLHFTTGETVGTAAARFPDGGRSWVYTPPPVSSEAWPYSYDPDCEAFTTVSTWWGGKGKGEWVTDGDSLLFENNKRVSFLSVR